MTVFIVTEMIGKALKVTLLLTILIIFYYDGFRAFDNSIEDVVYGVFFFLLFWMVFSYLVQKLTSKHMQRFKDHEKTSCDVYKLNELKCHYENQYYDPHGKIDSELKEKISYQLMKQGFINPIELPCVTESFLRRDFNLALYFENCLKHMMDNMFTFGVLSCVLVLCIVMFWEAASMFGTRVESILLVLFPLFSFGWLYFQKQHFKTIKGYLLPQVEEPEKLNFQIDLDVRDPFDYYGTMQFPAYMEPSEKYDEESDGGSANEDVSSVRSRKGRGKNSCVSVKSESNGHQSLNDSIIEEEDLKIAHAKQEMFQSGETFLTYHQNRHERLFLFGKFGMMAQKIALVGFFVQMVLWMSRLVEYKYFLGEDSNEYYISNIDLVDYLITIASLALGMYITVQVYPSVLFEYMVITHIQMMKRRDMIEETVKEQRNQRSLRSFRMYQVFKLIRRELIHYFNQDISDKKLKPYTKKLIEENFALCKAQMSDNMDTLNIADFFPLCGAEIKKLENFILLKKAQSEGESIKFKDLLNAIEQTTNDVKVDPFEVVKTIFTLIMKNKPKLSIEDIKHFFNVYDGYFEREDVQDLLNELVAIQRDGSLIDVQEIASLIRDDIECFPR